jgi:hypothetical protein
MLTSLTYRGMEQWLARWAHNPKAGGSNPSPAISASASAEAFFLAA